VSRATCRTLRTRAHRTPGRLALLGCGCLLGLLTWACAPTARAADERESNARSEEIRNLEMQMEHLEAQLDSIYDKLDDYTASSAPPEILAERQRIEAQLQHLHEERSRALRELNRPTATSRRSLEPPEPPRAPARRKALANSLVKIGSNLVVRSDEIVNGDAIILGGNLRVEGEVLGDVVVLGGDLEIARSARVGGQALVVGGYLDEGRGAQIEGESLGLSFFPNRGGLRGGWSRAAGLLFDGIVFVLLLLVAGWFLVVHRRRFQRSSQYLQTNHLRSFGLGVLLLSAGTFVVSVLAMLLLVTFFGIPIALFLGVVTAVLLLAALCVGSGEIGKHLLAGFRWANAPRLFTVLIGLVLVLGPEFLGDLLSPFGTWLEVAMDSLSALVFLLALSLGLGALVLTRLGKRLVLPDAGGETTAPVSVMPG